MRDVNSRIASMAELALIAAVCLMIMAVVPGAEGKAPPYDGGTTTLGNKSIPYQKSLQEHVETGNVTNLVANRKKAGNDTICQNDTNTVIDCSTLNHKNFKININVSTPCVFRCSYNPHQMSPLRLEVHLLYKHPLQYPTFISIQQDNYLSSWTLPIIYSARGQDQKFTSLETLLCPPVNETKEVIEVSVSVRTEDMKEIQLALTNVSYLLQKHVNVSVIVTPASSWYKRYQWSSPYEESVLITALSDLDICGVLILQDAKCPVNSELSGLINQGRYQTFTGQAGMVARKSEFPDGVHIVVVSLPDDDACILNPESSLHNKTRNSRTKTVVLEVYDHATISSTWYIFLLTAIFLAIIAVAATVVILQYLKRTLSLHGLNTDDEDLLLGQSAEGVPYRVEIRGGLYVGGGPQRSSNVSSGQENNLPQNGIEDEGNNLAEQNRDDSIERRRLLAIGNAEEHQGSHEERQVVVPPLPSSFLPPTTHAPVGQTLETIDESFNPRFVLWWKSVAVQEAGMVEAQVSEVGFQNSLIIMGVFGALPTSELIRSYLGMVLNNGQEDQCFWNSRCLTAFGSLPDFARVFTNLPYVILGVAFVLIVRKHKAHTQAILCRFSGNDSVGVTHCYGLFVSLGYGLVLQGIMSALYHTCPNSVTIKFDMMFMYVMTVLAVVSIWGLRHGDVTQHVYPTVITVGLSLLVAEARMWLSSGWFWGLLTPVYMILVLSNAVLMSTHGIWSFSLSTLWHVWSAWKPVREKLKNVLSDRDTTSRPIQAVRVMVGVGGNIALIIYGILADPIVYYFILIVCMVNLGLYFVDYVLTKLALREKGTVMAWVCLSLSIILWIIALVFFYRRHTDSESSPASSRNKNSPCDFLGVFDDHDVWHITSSYALFFLFVALLTIDDDLCFEPSKNILVT